MTSQYHKFKPLNQYFFRISIKFTTLIIGIEFSSCSGLNFTLAQKTMYLTLECNFTSVNDIDFEFIMETPDGDAYR